MRTTHGPIASALLGIASAVVAALLAVLVFSAKFGGQTQLLNSHETRLNVIEPRLDEAVETQAEMKGEVIARLDALTKAVERIEK